MKKVLILGAAGRDFHNFNVVFRNNPDYQVVAFTATQIPDIAGRRYPRELAGRLYPEAFRSSKRKISSRSIADRASRYCCLFLQRRLLSDAHAPGLAVGRGRSRLLAAGNRTHADQIACSGRLGMRHAHRLRQESGFALRGRQTARAGPQAGGHSPSHALRKSRRAGRTAFCHAQGSRPAAMHDRRARRV